LRARLVFVAFVLRLGGLLSSALSSALPTWEDTMRKAWKAALLTAAAQVNGTVDPNQASIVNLAESDSPVNVALVVFQQVVWRCNVMVRYARRLTKPRVRCGQK